MIISLHPYKHKNLLMTYFVMSNVAKSSACVSEEMLDPTSLDSTKH